MALALHLYFSLLYFAHSTLILRCPLLPLPPTLPFQDPFHLLFPSSSRLYIFPPAQLAPPPGLALLLLSRPFSHFPTFHEAPRSLCSLRSQNGPVAPNTSILLDVNDEIPPRSRVLSDSARFSVTSASSFALIADANCLLWDLYCEQSSFASPE